MKKVRVGCGAAGWPDLMDMAWDVAEHGDVDYMGFDHLAELTMAILQRQRARNPNRGYIPDIIPLMRGLLPIWQKKGRHFRMVANSGGANPPACAEELLKVCQELNLKGGIKIGVITGDDIPLSRVDELRAEGVKFKALDTGEEDIDRVRDRLVGAYVYIGADKVIEAYDAGANLVIAGRLADNALYVANFMHGLGWTFENPDWDRIGAGVIVGHLLECGGWSCGICSNAWEQVPEPWHPSMPIAEMDETGETEITITPTTGGLVSELTLKEHLLYEVHDIHNYLMPDGIADFTTIKLEEVGKNRVKVKKLGDAPRGKPRPDTLKLCLAYLDGWRTEYTSVIAGPKVFKQAEKMTEYVYKRLERSGLKPREVSVSLIGHNSLFGSTVSVPPPECEPPELGFRVAFKCDTKEEARECRVQAGSLSWCAAGVGNAFGNSPGESEVFALWPTLIPREAVPLSMEIKEVK